ncbi:hypothetical protein CNR22_10730 [Sphingobacteriaceae bacterium]|nr:hypothetical protein CNR22_10730 [Sphingobacteriaceae bacterium]
MKNCLVLIALSLLLSGCVKLIYGLHDTKALDKKEIVELSLKRKIPAADNFELDTMYLMFLNKVDTFKYKSSERKNHYQPLQALYYNKAGGLDAFIINCYSRGFPNLKWNRRGILDTFVPKKQAPPDSILPMFEHLKYLKALPGAQRFTFGQDDYTVIVYWSYFMGRQSKRLNKAIEKNVKLAKGKKVRILYVNTDNFFKKTL